MFLKLPRVHQAKNNSGFTLIELIAAIGITTILITVGIAGFRSFADREKINNAARSIIAELRSIQTQASSNEELTGCTGRLTGYQVTFANAGGSGCTSGTRSTSYTVAALCPTATNPRTIQAPTGTFLCINRNAASANFTFLPLQAGTNIATNNNFVISVMSSSVARVQTVTITSSGQIQ